MTEDSAEQLRRLVETVRQARDQAHARPFRTRVLLDMVLVELEKEAAAPRRGSGATATGRP